MALSIYNTLTGSKEVFQPLDPNRVTLYVCGPTVYNYLHIGNGRSAVIFDTLVRLLRFQYDQVVFARNITDVDDKINQAAAQEGISIRELTDRYIQAYHEDIDGLNVALPDIEPRATDHISQMIAAIEQMISAGHAYAADGHVLFNVPSFKDYGKLSKRNTDDMLAGARVEVASYKKDPMDFVLWKPSADDQPGWESPWGRGRPGWHIECTAMIQAHLGNTIDIHGGGRDLTFPHHENELAQGTCCHDDEEYVRYWMHNGMLTVDGEKMSKSLGNFITIRDALQQYHGEHLRLMMLSSQYRSSLDWTDALIKQSKQTLDRFYNALAEAQSLEAKEKPELLADFVAAMNDDLNTPLAIAAMHELAGHMFKAESDDEKQQLKWALLTAGDLLGILYESPEQWFTAASDDAISPEAIEQLIAERTAAKKSKDFARADAIRVELDEAGVEIQDTPEGVRWRRKG
ncbi:cysteine--tRNA ligase [Salinibius halmophilus]|uniref:cysteine--tRNA ligase n=1 Tax=Salinibius halmophilus TaxID=1853216 RepID=UPI000E669BF5|nr:cysteine--tRNA ligase [Salinibius halmophilus]